LIVFDLLHRYQSFQFLPILNLHNHTMLTSQIKYEYFIFYLISLKIIYTYIYIFKHEIQRKYMTI
jgi:hypothetical protein